MQLPLTEVVDATMEAERHAAEKEQHQLEDRPGKCLRLMTQTSCRLLMTNFPYEEVAQSKLKGRLQDPNISNTLDQKDLFSRQFSPECARVTVHASWLQDPFQNAPGRGHTPTDGGCETVIERSRSGLYQEMFDEGTDRQQVEKPATLGLSGRNHLTFCS